MISDPPLREVKRCSVWAVRAIDLVVQFRVLFDCRLACKRDSQIRSTAKALQATAEQLGSVFDSWPAISFDIFAQAAANLGPTSFGQVAGSSAHDVAWEAAKRTVTTWRELTESSSPLQLLKCERVSAPLDYWVPIFSDLASANTHREVLRARLVQENAVVRDALRARHRAPEIAAEEPPRTVFVATKKPRKKPGPKTKYTLADYREILTISNEQIVAKWKVTAGRARSLRWEAKGKVAEDSFGDS